MDYAGKLVPREVQAFCADHGIHLVPVPAYRHALNGLQSGFSIRCFA